MRKILKLLGVVLGIICALVLIAWAFETWDSSVKSSRDQARLDTMLSNSAIDRVEVEYSDIDKKNLLLGEQARSILATFHRTNRIPWSGPMFLKYFFAGYITFLEREQSNRRGIAYLLDYNAASYGKYYFQLKGTNDLRRVFEWRRTNETEAAISR